jgi:monothiol glutaredoxin
MKGQEMAADTNSRIKDEIASSDVVLFMKGTPAAPQCGFSMQVVQILNHIGVPYKAINVLADQEIREGIKGYSNWPTIPQLYVKNEFIGGCDITREMFQSGELTALLDKEGVPHKQTAKA